MRWRIDRSAPFLTTLKAFHEVTIEALAQAMPFVELVRALEDKPAPGHHPKVWMSVRFAPAGSSSSRASWRCGRARAS